MMPVYGTVCTGVRLNNYDNEASLLFMNDARNCRVEIYSTWEMHEGLDFT